MGLSDAGRDYGIGWRLVGGRFALSSQAGRRESANEDTPPEHDVGLRMTARF